MIPLDPNLAQNNSFESIVKAITAYEQETKSDATEVTKKIAEFVQNNKNVISANDQKHINELASFLGDTIYKESSCKELVKLIQSCAQSIQKKTEEPKPDDKPARLAKAERVFKKTFWAFPKEEFFKGFVSLTNEEERLAIIVKIFSKDNMQSESDTSKFCANIKKFGLSEQSRIIVALQAAEIERKSTGSVKFSEYLQDFQLPYDVRVAISKKNDIYKVCDTLNNYDLKASDQLEIAERMLLKQNYKKLLDNIHKFKIPEPEKFEIAKQVAEALYDHDHLCRLIPVMELTEPHRMEIATILASRNGSVYHIIGRIKEFKLPYQSRFKIAQLAAETKPSRMNVKPFELELKERTEIAKIVAASDGDKFLKSFSQFQINDVKERLALIKMALVNAQPFDLMRLQDDFSEPERKEIAWAVGKIDGVALSNSIERYIITDENTLLELFLLALRNAPPDSAEEIFKNFKYRIFYKGTFEDSASFKFLDAQAKAMTKAGEDDIQAQIQTWLKIFDVVCRAKMITEETFEKLQPYAEQILKYKDPLMRYSLMEKLFQFKIPPKPASDDLLFEMLLLPLLEGSGISDHEAGQIRAILSRAEYCESSNKEKVLKGMIGLLDCETLTKMEKGRLLKHVFEKEMAKQSEKEKESKAVKTKTSRVEKELRKKEAIAKVSEKTQSSDALPAYTSMQILDAILASGNAELLKSESGQDKKEADAKDGKAALDVARQRLNLEETLNKCFTQALGIEEIDDFGKKFSSTIGKGRNSMALMIYATKLGSLGRDDRTEALKSLSEFAKAVLQGTYQTWRYQTPQGSHLEKIFEDNVFLRDTWQKGESLSLSELNKETAASAVALPVKAVSSGFNVVQYLNERTEHLKPHPFESLKACLKKPAGSIEVLKKLAEENKKDKLPLNAEYNEKTKTAFLRTLEYALIRLLDSSIPAAKKVEDIERYILPKLREIYKDNPQIIRDLIDLQEHLKAQSQIASKENMEQRYTIEDTDKWDDMLLCGTEVAGSCQRISGYVYYNKCLLAYLADGKNRAIVLKDKNGKIVARSIMRLLWNDTEKKPVLFQEQLYHNPGVPVHALNAMNMMFMRRAAALKVTLVRNRDAGEGLPFYTDDLISLNSPAPFEYVDAGATGVTNGKFTIPSNNISLVQA